MKSKKSYAGSGLILMTILLLAGCATKPAEIKEEIPEQESWPAEKQDAIIDEIIKLNGIDRQLAQLPDLFDQFSGIAFSQGNLSSEAAAVFVSIYKNNFKPEMMLQQIAQEMKRSGDRQTLTAVLVMLRSELAQKMVELEVQSASPSFLSRLQGYNLEEVSQTRKRLIESLLSATKSADFYFLLLEEIVKGMFKGLQAIVPDEAKANLAEGEARAISEFQGQRQMIEEYLFKSTALVYEDATDQEIADYAELYRTEEATWLIEVIGRGTVNAFRAASENVFKDLMQALPALIESGTFNRAEQLQVFESAAGRFSIATPAKFAESAQSVDTQVGPIEVHVFTGEKGGVAYTVGYSDYPEEGVAQSNPEDLLNSVRDGVISNLNGKLMFEIKTSLAGFPGRNIIIDIKTSDGGISTIKAHIYLVKNRLYQVLVVGPTGEISRAEMDEYLDSFRLLDE